MKKYLQNIFSKIVLIYKKLRIERLKSNIMLILLFYLLIIITVIIYFGYYNYKENVAISIENKIDSINAQIDTLTSKTESDLDELYKIGINIYEAKNVQHKIETEIDRYFELKTEITGITIYTFAEGILSYNNIYSPYYFNGCSLAFVKEIMRLYDENEKDFILIPRYADKNSDTFLAIKYFGHSLEENTGGIIIIEVSNAFLKSWPSSFQTKYESTIILEDTQGNAFFIKDTDSLNLKINDMRKNFDFGSSNLSKDKINNQEIYIFSKESEKFYVYLFLPTEQIELNSISRQNSILFSIIIGVILMSITFLFFRKKIYNPIKRFEKALQSMVQGEFDNKVYIGGGYDLYVLSDSLNSLIKRLRDLIDREYNAKVLKKQAEFNALQSQINPHFLYNTLESIRGEALCEGVDNIANMTKALSNLFKYTISYKENLVSFSKELKSIENYLLIQQFRFDNRFDIIYKIQEDTLEFKLPKLTIQPIIENAITHGYETKTGRGTIILRAYRTEKRLVISIEDDGIGISEEKLNRINQELSKRIDIHENDSFVKSSSIGLININERIRLYFDERYGIRVYSTLNLGTTVEIIIPLIKD